MKKLGSKVISQWIFLLLLSNRKKHKVISEGFDGRRYEWIHDVNCNKFHLICSCQGIADGVCFLNFCNFSNELNLSHFILCWLIRCSVPFIFLPISSLVSLVLSKSDRFILNFVSRHAEHVMHLIQITLINLHRNVS